jgi:hypothetical protein
MTNGTKMRAKSFVVAAAVIGITAITYGDSPISLTNGVPVPGLSGAAGSQVFYKITVPAGQGELQIGISGGTGDCDLYVKRGSLPSQWSYDYRPYQSGNNETAMVSDPASGVWYIMLYGHAAYSGVTLVASFTPAVPTVLQNGVPQTGISGGKDSEKLYAIDVPAGQGSLEVNAWGGVGSVDVFLKRGSPPSPFDFDERSFDGYAEAVVNVSNPAAGTWYIMLHGSDDYHNVTLRAMYSGPVSMLQNDQPITNLSGSLGSETYYVFQAGPGSIEFLISGGTGNCDMYIKKGTKPTTSDWDYRPIDNGNNENLSVTGDAEGDWYILLVGKQAYSGVTLVVHYHPQPNPPVEAKVIRLTQGVPVTDIAGKAGSQQFFSIDVPNDAANLVIKMFGGTGDADLYVRLGSLPTTSDYDYRPYLTGSNEQVTISKPAAGTWYIMIRGYQAFSGITLVATFDSAISDGVTVLQNGVPVTRLAGGVGSEKFYKIDVPADQTKLEIAISGGTGDADLYVRLGAKPTTREWDYRPFVFGNKETVTIDDPKAGMYYIMVRAYMEYDGVTLKATYGPPVEQVKALENCVAVNGLAGAQDSETFFKIDVPAGQDLLRIEISGGTGDADLYVKKGEKPTAKSWDFCPDLHGNDEAVEIQGPAAATWYIMLRGYQAYSGVTLQACFSAGAKGDCGCTIIFF